MKWWHPVVVYGTLIPVFAFLCWRARKWIETRGYTYRQRQFRWTETALTMTEKRPPEPEPLSRFEWKAPIMYLADVNVISLAEWIGRISFTDWPQQDRVNGELRPAMVSDQLWHGFGAQTDALVHELLIHFPGCHARERMLSVVMPGHSIPPHVDRQNERWLTRVHVPLLTNPQAFFVVEGEPHNLEAGKAYLVDTRREHAIVNDGPTPRVHLMFDVWRGEPC